MNYQSIIPVHALIGISALVMFWIAALSRKGSLIHRQAGKAYVISMLIILISVVPMIMVEIEQDNIAQAVVLMYLFSIASVATYVTWVSIRNKKSKDKYHS